MAVWIENLKKKAKGVANHWQDNFLTDFELLQKFLSWSRVFHIFAVNSCWVLFGLNAKAYFYLIWLIVLLVVIVTLFVTEMIKYNPEKAPTVAVPNKPPKPLISYYLLISLFLFVISLLYSITYIFYSINTTSLVIFIIFLCGAIYLLSGYVDKIFSNDLLAALYQKVELTNPDSELKNKPRIAPIVLAIIEAIFCTLLVLTIIYSKEFILLAKPFVSWVNMPLLVTLIASIMLVILIYGCSHRDNHCLEALLFGSIEGGICLFILYQIITEIWPNMFLSITFPAVTFGLISLTISALYCYCSYTFSYHKSENNLAISVYHESLDFTPEGNPADAENSGGPGLVAAAAP